MLTVACPIMLLCEILKSCGVGRVGLDVLKRRDPLAQQQPYIPEDLNLHVTFI
jgi:hypothetical protein